MKKYLYLLFSVIPLLTGCQGSVSSGGEEMQYLQDIEDAKETLSRPLLPLSVGTYWEMNAVSEAKKTRDKVTVVGPVTIRGKQGVLVKIMRGDQLWRQEVYQNNQEGIFLLAFGEKKVELLELDPPMKFLNSRFKNGDELSWKGRIYFLNKSYPASGYCRASSLETIQTKMGRFQAQRLDSVITMERPGEIPLHFPAIRWLSQEIGFIRRSYADGGKPAIQELDRYMVPGK
jgi:hypothetical protein